MRATRSRVVLAAIIIMAALQFLFWNKAIHRYAFELGVRTAEMIEAPEESKDE